MYEIHYDVCGVKRRWPFAFETYDLAARFAANEPKCGHFWEVKKAK